MLGRLRVDFESETQFGNSDLVSLGRKVRQKWPPSMTSGKFHVRRDWANTRLMNEQTREFLGMSRRFCLLYQYIPAWVKWILQEYFYIKNSPKDNPVGLFDTGHFSRTNAEISECRDPIITVGFLGYYDFLTVRETHGPSALTTVTFWLSSRT